MRGQLAAEQSRCFKLEVCMPLVVSVALDYPYKSCKEYCLLLVCLEFDHFASCIGILPNLICYIFREINFSERIL